jgi:hypothetical protein
MKPLLLLLLLLLLLGRVSDGMFCCFSWSTTAVYHDDVYEFPQLHRATVTPLCDEPVCLAKGLLIHAVSANLSAGAHNATCKATLITAVGCVKHLQESAHSQEVRCLFLSPQLTISTALPLLLLLKAHRNSEPSLGWSQRFFEIGALDVPEVLSDTCLSEGIYVVKR